LGNVLQHQKLLVLNRNFLQHLANNTPSTIQLRIAWVINILELRNDVCRVNCFLRGFHLFSMFTLLNAASLFKLATNA